MGKTFSGRCSCWDSKLCTLISAAQIQTYERWQLKQHFSQCHLREHCVYVSASGSNFRGFFLLSLLVFSFCLDSILYIYHSLRFLSNKAAGRKGMWLNRSTCTANSTVTGISVAVANRVWVTGIQFFDPVYRIPSWYLTQNNAGSYTPLYKWLLFWIVFILNNNFKHPNVKVLIWSF